MSGDGNSCPLRRLAGKWGAGKRLAQAPASEEYAPLVEGFNFEAKALA